MPKKVKFPLWDVYDNPSVKIETGEFSNVLPDGTHGPSGRAYEHVLKSVAARIRRNRKKRVAPSE